MQPLAGLLVLDFSTLLPGPICTLMLAEAGAEVIKIEKPGGEDMRFYPPFCDGVSAPFALLNRGKRALALDLKRPADRDRLRPLLARADILVEQFRPGVMARLGLDYETLRQTYPRLIYCSITGYGQTGPRANEAGHDLNYIAATGLLSLNPGSAAAPTVPPALIADIGGGGLPAVINILLALRQRDRTGQGCHLDIAMSDAMFAYAWYGMAAGAATGVYPGARQLPVAGGSPRYQLYPTADGRFVACGALEDKFWQAFCAVIGLTAPLCDDRVDPAATQAEAARLVAARPAAAWAPLLAAADCCAGIVATLDEALADPHFQARGLFQDRVGLPSGRQLMALPVPVAPPFRSPPGTQQTVPELER